MNKLVLPRISGTREMPVMPEASQLTVIGGSGVGKTKFIEELIRLNSDRAYCISVLSAPFPEREESTRPGSIDVLYREAAERRSYMRRDAVSELDKLSYLIFTDEFEYLLSLKQNSRKGVPVKLAPTRLDRLVMLWERVFPSNRIIRTEGTLMFSTASGSDLISLGKLSKGEQTVLYYAAAVLYAMPGAVIFVDSPSLFIHPSVLGNLWNAIEELRPDCTFVYDSVDVGFVNSRTSNVSIWVKSYDVEMRSWDYEVILPGDLNEDMFVDLVGTRKPVLFIEGDARHSIDSKLYPLVFADWTVKPLGSCDKVIETTRTFNDLKNMHHLKSKGIVDRDRRTDNEVDYLRRKSVMVPEVAEVENLFLLEGVVKAMARRRGRNPEKVFGRVSAAVMDEFRRRFDEQALQHVRHRVKREVECRIDARFPCITAMELHIGNMVSMLRPREKYNEVRASFQKLIDERDYNGILKVFNHKPILGDCGVAHMLGYKTKDEYVAGVIGALKEDGVIAEAIRESIRYCFRVDEPVPEKKRHVQDHKPEPPRQNKNHAKPTSARNPKSHNNKKRRKNVN